MNRLIPLFCIMTQLTPLVSQAAPPRLEKQGTAMRLLVKNKPMLVLGGELGNSSASSAAYLAPHWPRLARMHLNTVLAPVSWELIEPVEGRFRWDSIDTLLENARAHQLKLILLWTRRVSDPARAAVSLSLAGERIGTARRLSLHR